MHELTVKIALVMYTTSPLHQSLKRTVPTGIVL